MRLKKLIAGGVAALTMASGLALAAPAGAAEPAKPTLFGAVAASLNDNGGKATDRNWYDFDILANGVVAAGLQGALDDPNANLTVFIPNDRAFQALVADLYGFRYWFASESAILGKVVELETAKPGTLATVITYHAVPGRIDSKTALSVKPGTELTTLQGGTIKVYPVKIFGSAILGDNDRNDVDPFLVPGKLDIQASNGIAHGIAFVLRPADL
jgi:uncharacterized surface protein with fasciclin (FAS1) repeats